MRTTKVILCEGCPTHEYQDRRYGKGKRVHNRGKKNWVCTVNRHEVSLTDEELKGVKKDSNPGNAAKS